MTTDFFLRVAAVVGEGSDCRRRRIGAVITYGGRIVSAAYNGPADISLSCDSGDCPRGLRSLKEVPREAPYDDCIAVHAEIAALDTFEQLLKVGRINTAARYWAAKLPEEVRMYVSDKPCPECAPILGWAGIEVSYPFRISIRGGNDA